MHKIISAYVIALTVGISSLASAEVNTVSAGPKYRNGNLFSCEIVFENYLFDTAYFAGAPVYVTGSWAFNFFEESDSIWGMLKIGVTYSDQGNLRTAPLSDGFIIVNFESNASERELAIDSETPGFKLFGFSATEERTLSALIAPFELGVFTVAYTVNSGSMPTTFDVVMSETARQNYSECVSALGAQISAKLPAN